MVTATRLTLPSSLQQANATIIAFSPKIRMHPHSVKLGAVPDNRYSPVGPYWFDDLKQAYNFPSYKVFSGSGRSIGILMSNDFLDQDMAKYFGHEGLPVPKICRVPINGGGAFDVNASAEVSLDIQQAGGMAPNATIYDYNVPDLSDLNLIDGLIQMLSDNSVDIVNMSYGGPEGTYTAAYNEGIDFTNILRVYDAIFKQGNAQGITFVASSGDSGALGLPPVNYVYDPPLGVVVGDFQVGVEFPASSPHVTAVGGTNLVTKSVPGSLTSAYVRENAHSDPEIPYDPFGVGNNLAGGVWGSGGGISGFFPKPSYQRLVNTGSNMRTIPDLSLQMGGCPADIAELPCGPNRSATVLALDGNLYGVIGTSVSAPDFAGVLALTEERFGGRRLGNANTYIYSLAAAQNFGILNVFHQGIPGDNGYYYSQKDVPGYNLVLGNGTLSVRDFMLAPEVPKAGKPQTPSNP
jgi:subtilase family serine protease